MRFISVYPGLRVVLRNQRTEQLADGSRREIRPGLYAQFAPNEFNEREREAAFERFGNQIYKGSRMTDETLTVPASQIWRIGVWDSAWIDADERGEAERLMLAHRRLNLDFIHVEPVRVPKPWANIDKIRVMGRRTMEHVVAEIVRITQEIGVDPAAVAAWERDNENRYEVLAALAALTADEPEEELVEA
jgi:hypothetical protein